MSIISRREIFETVAFCLSRSSITFTLGDLPLPSVYTSCTLKGGVVGDPAKNTITFNLVHPDAEFLFQLAVPFTSILPASAPPKDSGIKPIPGTGPYSFTKYDPSHELVMSRNPHFKVWSASAQPQGYPDVIRSTFGQTSENEVTAIENGQADWMYDAVPSDRLTELSTKYASQIHVDPVAGVFAGCAMGLNAVVTPILVPLILPWLTG